MKKKSIYWALLLAVALTAGCSNTEEKADAEAEKVDFFADNGLGNALAIVQHPAGIHEEGITYVSYQGPLEDPYVASYNHVTGKWLGPFKAGVSDMGKDLTRKKKIDNHGKPTMLIDDLGFIHIFFGGHGGEKSYGVNHLGDIHYGGNKHAVSKRPRDITEWQELNTISPFGTYNQAIKMDNGDIYLFYRHGAHRSNWVYQKSTDHGRTFEAPVSFLKHKRRADIEASDSWYAWVTRGEGDDILVSYDYHVCWNRDAGVNHRGHTTERHDVYYMVFDTQTGKWRNVSGEDIAVPVTREIADEKTLAGRTGGSKFWTFNGAAHLDENGNPHISINVGKDLGRKTGGPKQTTHMRWTGDRWVGGSVVEPRSRRDNSDTRGDFFLRSSTDIDYLLGYREAKDGVIAYFHSNDGGQTFEKGRELMRKPNATWAVTALIKNAHPDAQMIVAERQSGTNWRKVYLIGEGGAISREKSDSMYLTPEDKARFE